MKRFYNRKKISFNYFLIVIIFVVAIDLMIFNIFGSKLGNSISYIAKLKIDEITKYYLNSTIKKYLNLNTNDYIKVNLVNNNIVSVDIDNESSNKLLNNILNDLDSIVEDIEDGKINNYHNLEILKGDNGIILFMPVGVALNNPLFSNFGPSIPIKLSFLEDIDAYVDVVVENYGINNSLVKLYINISIKEVLEMPSDNRHSTVDYRFLVSSKIINGEVPSVLGGELSRSSNLVNNSVN